MADRTDVRSVSVIIEELNARFKGRIRMAEDNRSAEVPRDELIGLIQALRDDYKYAILADITAVDYGSCFELVYHVMDMDAGLFSVKVRLEKEDAVMPSLSQIWKAADVQEREIFDLMGIVFTGHGNLKRILCRDDFEGYPLRKDFLLNPVKRF